MRAFYIPVVIAVIGLCALVSAAVVLGGEGPPKPPELKVLERFVGTWDAESVSKPTVWTPKEVRAKYVEVRELVLDGWFVETKGRPENGAAVPFSWMKTYDLARKEYRQWLFVSGGFSVEWRGQWDEATKTFSLAGDAGNGITSKATTHFIDEDHMEFSIIATDSDGKVYQDMKGKLARRGAKPKPAASSAQRAGLYYKMPKDGTWATYQVDGSGDTPDGEVRMKGTIRIASVGQVTEGGHLCRWIELTFEMGMLERGRKFEKSPKECFKVLVPEKFLVQSETPLDHAIRAWQRSSEKGEPENVRNPKDINDSPLALYLSGPLKDAKPLPKAEVESKLGKLLCDGVTGGLDMGQGKFKARFTIEHRLHPAAPFGLVSSRVTGPILAVEKRVAKPGEKGTPDEGTPMEMGKMELNLKLVDFGANATSEMPDAK